MTDDGKAVRLTQAEYDELIARAKATRDGQGTLLHKLIGWPWEGTREVYIETESKASGSGHARTAAA